MAEEKATWEFARLNGEFFQRVVICNMENERWSAVVIRVDGILYRYDKKINDRYHFVEVLKVLDLVYLF